MKHMVSRELHRYWDRLRGGRAAPERADLDPTAIRSILADTFVLEIARDHATFGHDVTIRLSGTRLNALFGRELKGLSLFSLWREDNHAAVRNLVDLVLDEQVPVVAGSSGEAGPWGVVELELLLLPLRHHGKTHARLFGSIASGDTSRWRGTQALGALKLTSFRTVDAQTAAPFHTPPTSTARQHGRFLVYDGGR